MQRGAGPPELCDPKSVCANCCERPKNERVNSEREIINLICGFNLR
jgi:hypothetical protein